MQRCGQGIGSIRSAAMCHSCNIFCDHAVLVSSICAFACLVDDIHPKMARRMGVKRSCKPAGQSLHTHAAAICLLPLP